MPKAKGSKKVGGRTKGTPNKITLDALQVLRDLGHEPIAKHVQLYRESISNYVKFKTRRNGYGSAGHLEAALRANAEIMKYVYPTRKAVEHTGAEGEPLFKSFTDIIIELGDEDDEAND